MRWKSKERITSVEQLKYLDGIKSKARFLEISLRLRFVIKTRKKIMWKSYFIISFFKIFYFSTLCSVLILPLSLSHTQKHSKALVSVLLSSC